MLKQDFSIGFAFGLQRLVMKSFLRPTLSFREGRLRSYLILIGDGFSAFIQQ